MLNATKHLGPASEILRFAQDDKRTSVLVKYGDVNSVR
jgi:hypothetical protein